MVSFKLNSVLYFLDNLTFSELENNVKISIMDKILEDFNRGGIHRVN